MEPISAYLTSYGGVTVFTVNTSTALTNYDIPINLTNASGVSGYLGYLNNIPENRVYTNGTTRPDWYDVLITDGNDTVLPFWIENNTQTSVSAQAWVNLSSISTSNNTIVRVYYGKSSITSPTWNGNQTFPLWDDFNTAAVDTAKWTTTGGTTSNGYAIIPPTTTDNIASVTTFAGGYAYKARNNASAWSTVGTPYNMFGFRINSGSGAAMTISNIPLTGQFQLLTQSNGGSNTGSSYAIPSPNNFDTYNIVRNGTASALLWIDKTAAVINTANVPTNSESAIVREEGASGLGYIYSDWVFVRPYVYPEPLTSGYATYAVSATYPISISNLQIWNISLPTQALTQTAPYTYQPGNFGGLPAQIPLTSGNPVVHTYTSPNAGYTVTDTAWDQYGGFSQATGTVPVYINVPYASFTESPTSGQASLLVTFTDTSYRGTASGLSYNWSFGDSSGTNPYSNVIGNTTHVYAYNGLFYPNLTITNANGTSYYVGQPITLSNTQTQTYYLPTQVRLKFTDYNGAPLTGVSVVATPINFSAPAGWINALLGINPSVNIVGTSVGLNTDTLGVCAMPMVQSIEYSIVVEGTSASNPAETVNTTFNLFPVQTAYEIPLPTNLVPYALPTPQTATTNITYSITNTTGASTQTYTTTYNDTTGGTTALQLFVENTTGAWIASSNYTGSAANSETFSQSEPNPNGGTYTWGFLATQAQLGNITQTKTANFPEFINLMGAPGGWPT